MERPKFDSFNDAISALNQVKEASEKAGRDMDKQAHEHPWIFVAAAALFSFLCGFLMGRKSNR